MLFYLCNPSFSLLQLDANLIEREPYNCLEQLKNKRRPKWRDKIQIYRKYGKQVFKARQNERRQWGPVRCHRHTDFFSRTVALS